MGHDPDREPPFFFMKPADAIVPNGATIPYPQMTKDLHHEIEMVVAIGKGGADIPVEQALEHVFGYGVGLDMTRRDLQGEAKKMGRPWEMGKAFDNSAPCTALKPVAMVGHPSKGAIWLKVNGKLTQKGDLAAMIWNVPETIVVSVEARHAARGRSHHVRHARRRGSGESGDTLRGTSTASAI